MRSRTVIGLAVSPLLLAAAGSAWANNLVVTNVAVSPRDTNTAFVAFAMILH